MQLLIFDEDNNGSWVDTTKLTAEQQQAILHATMIQFCNEYSLNEEKKHEKNCGLNIVESVQGTTNRAMRRGSK